MANAALFEAIWAFTSNCPAFKTNCDFEFVDGFIKLISLLHCCMVVSDQASSLLIAHQFSPSPSEKSKETAAPIGLPQAQAPLLKGLKSTSPIFDVISGVVQRSKVCSECHHKTVVEEPIISLDFVVLFNDEIPPIRKVFKEWKFDEGMRTRKIKTKKWKMIPLITQQKEVSVSTIYDYLSHFNSTPGAATEYA
jgi:hypothetical protein